MKLSKKVVAEIENRARVLLTGWAELCVPENPNSYVSPDYPYPGPYVYFDPNEPDTITSECMEGKSGEENDMEAFEAARERYYDTEKEEAFTDAAREVLDAAYNVALREWELANPTKVLLRFSEPFLARFGNSYQYGNKILERVRDEEGSLELEAYEYEILKSEIDTLLEKGYVVEVTPLAGPEYVKAFAITEDGGAFLDSEKERYARR